MAAFNYLVVIGLGLAITVAYGRTVKKPRMWSDCTSSDSPVKITHLDISPSPVTLPGDMFFSLKGYSNRTMGSSRLILNIVRRLQSWPYIEVPVPCFFNVGSCTYADMCTLLDEMVTSNWLGISRQVGQGIQRMLEDSGVTPGLCPQPPQVITIDNRPLPLPTIPPALYWFAEGLYRAHVRVIDNSNGQELSCIHVDIEMKRSRQRCSSWFGCLF